MPSVLRTSQAHLDLVESALWIAKENPTAANLWLEMLEAKCIMLAEMPEMGRKRFELAPNLRSFPVGNYIIFYRPAPEGIQIIRVLHGARDIPALFK